jgi:hypothetical protein
VGIANWRYQGNARFHPQPARMDTRRFLII